MRDPDIAVYANGASLWATIAKDGDQAAIAAAAQQAARDLLAALGG